MSKRLPAELTCPKCSNRFPVQLFRSIWIENPEYRALITEDKINRFDCPKCSYHINTEFPFLATNAKRGIAIWYEPQHDSQIDKDVEDYKKHMGANSFYALAPRINEWAAFKAKMIALESKSAAANEFPQVSDAMMKNFAGFIDSMKRAREPAWKKFLKKIFK